MSDFERNLQEAERLEQAGRLVEAEAACRALLERRGDERRAKTIAARCAHRLGMSAAMRDALDEAVACFLRAETLEPDQPAHQNNRALALKRLDRLEESEAVLRSLVARWPADSEAWTNLGEVCKSQGNIAAAVAAQRQALALRPDLAAAHSNLCLSLQYDGAIDRAAVFAEHRRYGERFGRPTSPPRSFLNSSDPDRPLRIGYVSPDFRKHAAARFIEPMLMSRDRQQFQVFLYGELAEPDAITRRFAAQVEAFRTTAGRSADEVAAQIAADGIDILVEMAGHTAHHRLDVMARRPAPISTTYLGYPDTTGLTTIDYRLTDGVLDPPGAEAFSTEKLIRLPGSFACFHPPLGSPEVAPPPCQSRGYVTFGSHHQLFKLNDDVLRLWKRVLDAVPNARLMLLRNTFTTSLETRMRKRLASVGIDPARAEFFRPQRDDVEYLNLFAQMDVVLDAFPFNGHTTNCEALWMGVPVVTLRGERPAARLASSVLTALGRSEWIAATPDEYVAIAARLASDADELARSRAALRDAMRRTVCDAPTFMRGLEAEYRAMWRRWCAEQPAAVRVAATTTPTGPALSVAEHSRQGLEHIRANRPQEALPHFQAVVTREPQNAAGHFNLGNLLKMLGRDAAAADAHRTAALLDPRMRPLVQSSAAEAPVERQVSGWNAERAMDEARKLASDGRWPEVAAACRKVLELDANHADALGLMGVALHELTRAAESVEFYRRSLAVRPNAPAVWNYLGNTYQTLSRWDDAIEAYRKAVEYDPACGGALCNLGHLLNDQGRVDEAREYLKTADRLDPNGLPRLLSAVGLPIIYDSAEELYARRRALEANMQALIADRFEVDLTHKQVPTLFYAAYHGVNDRPLQQMAAKLYRAPQPVEKRRLKPRSSRLRVGFLSRYFCNHTMGRLNLDWVRQFDRKVAEVFVIAPPHDDTAGRGFRAAADTFVPLPGEVARARQTVVDCKLDVVVFTDVGMDPLTNVLAYSRMAPVQCVTWGHPVTTGSPAMDYFISSKRLEAPEGDDFYTEQLLRFDDLCVCYERPKLPTAPRRRESFGYSASDHLYVCPQTLFKLHPEFDAICAAILRGDPRGRLVLLEGKYPYWEQKLRERFARTMPDVVDRIRFLPAMPRDEFLALCATADVLLDPIHFGGGNSTYEGLAMGTPVVSLPSRQLRARITLALYGTIGVDDCLVDSPEAYVAQALRLANDADYRRDVSGRILATCGELFGRTQGFRQFEQFLMSLVDEA
jgi:predicted O-linked N-acetylglucosamine transferase (SPINDLY family)